MAITEDDIYRASTQYRLWSFTPEALASLRVSTNGAASERVVAAIRRSRAAHISSADQSEPHSNDQVNGSNGSNTVDIPIDCLTPAEELALLTHYTTQTLHVADAFSFPTSVKATAAQYLKRFYLSNSPMTYHPKNIFPACLFLATKTENNYISLERFTDRLNGIVAAKKKVTPEDVVAPEFIVTQGLRFTFEVRHPGRGLRGGLLELLAMAQGDAALLPRTGGRTPKQIQNDMLAISPASDAASNEKTSMPLLPTPKELANRCGQAHDRAKETLASAALLTDVYFLYTPAQIWLAALLLADEPLTLFYLSTKFPDTSSAVRMAKLLDVLRTCAAVLGALPSSQREELVRIDKKLYKCQNPEKRDLVELNAARKRNGVELDENKAKKRKVERERGEREGDVFGGDLGKAGNGGDGALGEA